MKKKSRISLVKKDIEWLRDEINELPLMFVGFSVLKQREEFAVDRDDVLELINQLDEPEVKQLERKIKELDSFNDELIRDNNQFRNELDNQEVLSQELPTIPRFVADWIEEVKKQNKSLVFAIAHIYDKNEIDKNPNKEEERIFLWMELADNEEVFARAWLDGYTVEKEQKYYVLNVSGSAILRRNTDKEYDSTIAYAESGRLMKHIVAQDEEHLYQFTEEEIKEYDDRYWAFRKPVEEMEE